MRINLNKLKEELEKINKEEGREIFEVIEENGYLVIFAYEDIPCPHCGNETRFTTFYAKLDEYFIYELGFGLDLTTKIDIRVYGAERFKQFIESLAKSLEEED